MNEAYSYFYVAASSYVFSSHHLPVLLRVSSQSFAMALRRVPCLLARRIPTKNVRPSLALHAPVRGLTTAKSASTLYASLDTFPDRHIGPSNQDVTKMLSNLGYKSIDDFVADTVPPKIGRAHV